MSIFIRYIIGYLLYISQVWKIFQHQRSKKTGLEDTYILNYHRISQDRFASHIRFLKRHYHIASLHDLITRSQSGKSFPHPTVIITFDDGNLCCYTDVFPVIRHHQIPVSIFLTTGYIDTDELLWFDSVEYALIATSQSDITFDETTYTLHNKMQRAYAARMIIETLKPYEESEKQKKIEEILSTLKAPIDPPVHAFYKCMTWDQISEMSATGVDFGGHTITHPILTQISPEQADQEIGQSKRTIEEHLNKPIVHFAYPNGAEGDFNDTTGELLKKHTFRCGLSTVHDRWHPDNSLYTLPRFIVTDQLGSGTLIVKLSGLWQALTHILRK
jgi:peptidoglycan/xylan/chitin deacetylase (PgdA/CDA1 family)